ncbi:hypothetical protein [Streptomyces sp. GSL17-111]|uniref:hypothetical protein n=1 Tax=Streptomyces sp. GSL17-111 TaxID=3121596 RepID=UPI0030F4541F
MTTARARRHAMTSRDLDVRQWVGRWRAVTCDQVTREFDRRAGSTRRREVYERRMRALHGLGLLRQAGPLGDRPRVHWLTRAGMTAASLEGAPASPSVAELVHDLEVVELADHLTRIQPDHHLVTEQEIRHCEPNPSSGPARGCGPTSRSAQAGEPAAAPSPTWRRSSRRRTAVSRCGCMSWNARAKGEHG